MANLQQERKARHVLAVLDDLASNFATVPGPKTIVLFSGGFALRPVQGALRSTIQRAAAAGVRIYIVDTRGLESTEPSDALNSLAWDTGGRFIFNANNLPAALREIALDAGVYYMLGYYPTNTANDGRFRRIEVRVKRRGLRVRARKG